MNSNTDKPSPNINPSQNSNANMAQQQNSLFNVQQQSNNIQAPIQSTESIFGQGVPYTQFTQQQNQIFVPQYQSQSYGV